MGSIVHFLSLSSKWNEQTLLEFIVNFESGKERTAATHLPSGLEMLQRCPAFPCHASLTAKAVLPSNRESWLTILVRNSPSRCLNKDTLSELSTFESTVSRGKGPKLVPLMLLGEKKIEKRSPSLKSTNTTSEKKRIELYSRFPWLFNMDAVTKGSLASAAADCFSLFSCGESSKTKETTSKKIALRATCPAETGV